MKKSLLVTASFFVLGAFLMSPLYGMNRDYTEMDGERKKLSKRADFLFLPEMWTNIARFLKREDQAACHRISKEFDSVIFKAENAGSHYYQWNEFKISEKALGVFNTFLIRHIRSNVDRLIVRPLNDDLRQYTKNYEHLKNFPGLPEESFVKDVLIAQHLRLEKVHLREEKKVEEEWGDEENSNSPKQPKNTSSKAAEKAADLELAELEENLIQKQNDFLKKNPSALNELGLSYLSFLTQKLIDENKMRCEIKFITFESYLNGLEKNLSAGQKECSMIAVFTDFEKLYEQEMRGIKCTLDIKDNSADSDNSEDIGEGEGEGEDLDKYSIEDYRYGRDLCFKLGKKYSDFGALDDGTSYSHKVLDFEEATTEDWRIARDAHARTGEYEHACYYGRDLPDLPYNPLELEDTRAASFLYLQVKKFKKAYMYAESIIEMLQGDATFEDYRHLILSHIGKNQNKAFDKDFFEKFNENIEFLEKKWGQDSEVQFFISFLTNPETSIDPESNLMKEAQSMHMDETTAFTQALKASVLEKAGEDVSDLRKAFFKKYSQSRYDSELGLLSKIDELLTRKKQYESEMDHTGKK